MKKDKRQWYLLKMLKLVKKTAVNGAGMASTKGVFEPEVPEKLTKRDQSGKQLQEKK